MSKIQIKKAITVQDRVFIKKDSWNGFSKYNEVGGNGFIITYEGSDIFGTLFNMEQEVSIILASNDIVDILKAKDE